MNLFKKMFVLAMALCLALSCLTVSAATTSPKMGSSVITKKADKIKSVTNTKKTYKKSKSNKKSYSFQLKTKKTSDTKLGKSVKVTYVKVSGCKFIKISKTGKVTVKKGIYKKCKGTKKSKTHWIKVKVYTSGNAYYKKATAKIIKVKVTIK